MSSNQVAAAVSQEFLENCFTVSAQALCIYDFCLTFTHEVQFMWKLKPSVGSVLFFTLRYTAQCNTIAVVFGYLFSGVWQDELCCTLLGRLQMTGDALILTSGVIFSALRIYALSRKNKWHLGVTLILGLINPVLSAYTFVLSTPFLAHLAPGHQTCSSDAQLREDIWMMVGRGSAVIFDAVALVLTWLSIKHGVSIRNRTDGSNAPPRVVSGIGNMSIVLMADTAVYFGFLTVINLVGIAFRKDLNAVSTWTVVMTSLLLNRLMLDLHQANSEGRDGGTYVSRAFASMVFRLPSAGMEGPAGHGDSLGSEPEESEHVDEVLRIA